MGKEQADAVKQTRPFFIYLFRRVGCGCSFASEDDYVVSLLSFLFSLVLLFFT